MQHRLELGPMFNDRANQFNIGDREIQGDDYFAVIEPVFLSVSIYDGPQRYEDDQ